MKKILLAVSSLALLAGCESTSNWSQDCETNFSTTNREKSQCMQKVEDSQNRKIIPESVSVDPENTDRQTFDQIGKGGQGDSEGS